MDLKEAFYKQKEELNQLKRDYAKLEKKLIKAIKGNAADERVQELLKKIQGLNNKIAEVTGIMNRYKALFEQKQKVIEQQEAIIYDLQDQVRDLQWQLDCLNDTRSSEGLTAAEEAKAKIAALSDEVARLTAKLENNSTNAGISTAKTAIDQKKRIPNSREKTDLKKGGQPGHEKYEMAPFSEDEVTDTQVHELEACPNCGSHNLEEIDYTIKDEYDYKVVVKKIRNRFIEYKCLDCGKIVRCPYNGLVAKNQYGNVIQSMALSLMNLGFVSINRTRKILTGFTSDDITLSEGYLAKLQKRYAKKLLPFVDEVKTRMTSLPLLYWDDTVVFVDTSRACLRFYGDDKLALYTAHLHKDLESLIDDDILPSLSAGTVVMHDHNTINYHQGFVFRNVECIQHLDRDLQKIIDIAHHSWASDLKELITSWIHKRKGLIADGISSFSPVEVGDFISKVSSILERAWTEWSIDQNRYFSGDERALIFRLEKYSQNYFEWVKDFSIPTTNNLSERSLRFVKTKDKVSGQFQSIEYASYFAAIRTYLETCARNGANEFTALLRLTQGQPYTISELIGEA